MGTPVPAESHPCQNEGSPVLRHPRPCLGQLRALLRRVQRCSRWTSGQVGLCKVKSVLGDWTCDDCTDIMTRVAAFMVKPETIEQGLAVLNGECFCGAEGHTAECPDLVASLAEPAMQVLSAVLMETTPELCQDIVGVC